MLCPEWTGEVTTVDAAREILETQGNDNVGFLQVFNPHLQCSKCREFVCSETLGFVAAQFLDADAVREKEKERKRACATSLYSEDITSRSMCKIFTSNVVEGLSLNQGNLRRSYRYPFSRRAIENFCVL